MLCSQGPYIKDVDNKNSGEGAKTGQTLSMDTCKKPQTWECTVLQLIMTKQPKGLSLLHQEAIYIEVNNGLI
jgi:hypothetical protein